MTITESTAQPSTSQDQLDPAQFEDSFIAGLEERKLLGDFVELVDSFLEKCIHPEASGGEGLTKGECLDPPVRLEHDTPLSVLTALMFSHVAYKGELERFVEPPEEEI